MFENASNINDIAGLLSYNNTITDGIFSYMLIMAFWMVAFFALSSYRKDVAIIPASFSTFLLCSIMVLLGIITVDVLLVVTVIMVIGYILFHLTM